MRWALLSGPSTRLAPVLWLLLLAFLARVLGQLWVVIAAPPWLPPMEAWMSGLIPYPYLLPSQVVILVVMVWICRDFSRGAGYFVGVHGWLARPTFVFGWVYFGAMVVRYGLTMWLVPAARWTGGTIPVVFHLVLASFVILVGAWHRARGRDHDVRG